MITIAVILLALTHISFSIYSNCSYLRKNRTRPKHYWINLKRSLFRAAKMRETFSKMHVTEVRINGVDYSEDELFVPDDLKATWPSKK